MIWLAVAICLAISFMFSGIEAGILSLSRVRLRNRLDQGDKAAIKLDRLLARPERLLATVLLVTNLMNILAVVLITQELVRGIGAAGYLASFAVCLPIYLMGVELLPKSLFRRFPYRALAGMSELLRITDWMLSPLLAVGSLAEDLMFPGKDKAKRKLFVAREDFKYFARQGEESGALSRIESQLIHNVVDYRASTARDVMKPLDSVQLARANTPVDELLALSRRTKAERFPAVSESNQIIGLVEVFDVLLDRTPRGNTSLHLRRILNVKPGEPAYTVMRKLRAARVSLACVVDADAKTIGIVSAEDLIKSLVKPASA